MRPDEPENKSGSTGPETTEEIVTWIVAATGSLVGTVEPVSGAVLGASAPRIGKVAGRIHQGLEALRARRVVEGMAMVKRGLDDQGATEENVERLGDIVTEAYPIFADAETDEKRRMIADIILTAAEREDTEAAKAEAMHALICVQEMTPAAALVFAQGARQLRESPADAQVEFSPDDGYAGLPLGVVNYALIFLHDHGLFEWPRPAAYGFRLTPHGNWLRDWILRNPPAERPEGDQGEE